MEFKQPLVLGNDLLYAPDDRCCYEYYIRNTESLGEYSVFSFKGREHKKSEFVSDIEAIAAYFKEELGLNRGDTYTIFMPTNAESMIIYMALNKIGVIVSFVHPLLPPENLIEIVKETKSRGIVILDLFLKGYAKAISDLGLPCLVCVPATYALPDKFAAKANPDVMAYASTLIKSIDTYPEALKKFDGKKVPSVTQCRYDVATYMNGGGTTGKSKTIMLTNDNLNYLVYNLIGKNVPLNRVGVDTEICAMPFFHAFGFCAGGLTSLHKGAKAVFMSKFDADEFIDIMQANPVTEFNGVPNMYKKLLENPRFDGPHLKSVRVMFSGGDDLRPAFLQKVKAVMEKNGSSAEICQGYGLTEACAVCTNNSPWRNKPGTIGTPIPMLKIEVWDENNQKVPNGTIGQFVMSGPTVMKGYLNAEGKDGEGLYTDEYGTKWVKSGDVGFYDEDNYLHFVGRVKRIVIISGYNVFPADIEKLLTELSFIKESCAVQGFDENDKKIIRLFVVLNDDCVDGDKEEYKKKITDIISARLSVFNVPKDIRFIDALPRTRIEKVDFMSLTQTSPEDKKNF